MGADASNQVSTVRPIAHFATTHWSMVVTAGNSSSPEAAGALEALCQTYWYPLYAFARRQGNGPEDAKDLTQGFFALLIQRHFTQRADPELGRFRTFLLRAFTDYLIDCRRHEHAAKRGGKCTFLPMDISAFEEHLAADHSHSPELLFDRKWALAVVGQATELLRAEYQNQNKSEQFVALKTYLQGDAGPGSYSQVGQALGLSSGAVKVAVYRLRQRYRELLRAVVAQTVNHPREIDDEVRYLVEVLTL